MNLIIFIIFFLVAIFLYNKMTRKQLSVKLKQKQQHDNEKEYLKYMFMGHKSKCFDCERQYDHPYKYKGHSSRCFSCETDLDRRLGPEYGFYGQPNKCYDCEKQMTF